MKNNLSTSAKFNPTELEKLTQEEKEKLTKQTKELTEVEGNLLPGDDLTSLTPEEREDRIRRARKALHKFLLARARALIDANPGSFNKIH